MIFTAGIQNNAKKHKRGLLIRGAFRSFCAKRGVRAEESLEDYLNEEVKR